MSLSPVIAVRLAGLLAGLSLVVAVAFGAWRVPASPQAAGVAAELRVVSSGEVGVQPAGAVVRSDGLTPGGAAASERVRLLNRTAGRLAAVPLVAGGDRALDRLLEVELRVGRRVAFRGPLADLRRGTAPIARLPRAGGANVLVAVRVPASAGEDAAAREGTWTLTFAAAPGAPSR